MVDREDGVAAAEGEVDVVTHVGWSWEGVVKVGEGQWEMVNGRGGRKECEVHVTTRSEGPRWQVGLRKHHGTDGR